MIKRAFTHLTASGTANMVDIGHKVATVRIARAQSLIKMSPETVKGQILKYFQCYLKIF